MRNIVAAIVCLVLVAGVASANNIHLYFSYQGDNSVVPAEFTGGANPVYQPGVPVYLWANLEAGDIWNGMSLDLFGTNAVVPSPLYNPGTTPNTRWNPGSDLEFGGDNHAFGVSVTELGLGNSLEPLIAPGYNIDTHWLLGEVVFDAAGGVGTFLEIGDQGIARSGGGPGLDDVYFGFTEPAPGQPDGPIPNNGFGQISTYPDIIPEPASLLLIGLAGLALRRR